MIKPKNIKEALQDVAWIVAMQEELYHLEWKKAWNLEPRPKDRIVIGTIWIFRNKLDDQGNIIINKIRLDIKSAFLNGYLKEEVFVCHPPGFESHEFIDHVYKLDKALYG